MSEKSKIKIGISVGDPNGIGIEIILKSFQDKGVYDFFTPIIFANTTNFFDERKRYNLNTDIFKLKDISKPQKGEMNVMDVWKNPFPISYGEEQVEAGSHAIESLRAATESLKKGDIDVLVTAPIHKKSIQSDNFNFPGHTDYLNQELEGESLMFMISNSLKIALVTDHIPLGEVKSHLSEKKIIKKIKLLKKSLEQDFGIHQPKIAVLGINPHAGDNGVIGKEDENLLRPLLRKLNTTRSLVYGPYSADGFFGNQSYNQFDATLAMYHDQGLIPFKTLSFGQGVNFTAGLSHVRTSPDHGTAFDIAGKGKANNSSFTEAIFSARSIFLNRKEHTL